MKLNEQLIEIVEHEARVAIDTLRHVTPPGHIESVLTEAAERITQLDSDNAALTKRVAELEQRLRFTAESLRSLSPGPHPGPMDAEDYVPLIARLIESLKSQLDCGQDGPCAKSPGCNRHWEERNRELVQRVAELERFAKPGSYWFTRATELESQLAWTPVSAGLPTEPGVYEFYDSLRRFVGWLTLFELRPDRAFPWIDDECIEWNQSEFEAHARSLYTHFRKVELPVCRIELPKDGESC